MDSLASLDSISLSAQEVMEKLDKEEERVLLFDLRSFLSFNQAHIKGAFNICIPKTLVKRQGFSIKSIESGLSKKQDRDAFELRQGATAILYDQSGTDKDPNGILWKCCDSLVKEGLCKKVFWLRGGIAEMQKEFPDMVRAMRNSGGLLNPPKPRLSISLTAPLTAPADLTSHDHILVEVNDYLFLSGSTVAEDYSCLKQHGITYIVNAAAELSNYFEESGEFHYLRLDLQDHPSQQICYINVLERAFDHIEEARKKGSKVLVHCRAGRSRSATVVIAYLMKSMQWTLQQAYDHVQSKNPKVSPNLGFMGQLKAFESSLRKRDKSREDLSQLASLSQLP